MCNHPNPPGADHCLNCANPLDTLSSIYMRTGQGIRHATTVRERHLVDTKHQDMQYMQKQRERLEEEERKRLVQLAAQRAEAQRQQKTLITIVLAAFATCALRHCLQQ